MVCIFNVILKLNNTKKQQFNMSLKTTTRTQISLKASLKHDLKGKMDKMLN